MRTVLLVLRLQDPTSARAGLNRDKYPASAHASPLSGHLVACMSTLACLHVYMLTCLDAYMITGVNIGHLVNIFIVT